MLRLYKIFSESSLFLRRRVIIYVRTQPKVENGEKIVVDYGISQHFKSVP